MSNLSWFMSIVILFLVTNHSAAAQHANITSGSALAKGSSFHRTWQIGAYGEGGFALNYHVGDPYFNYQKEQEFYTLTFEAGRMVTATHGRGIFAGRGEALGEVTPFWLTHAPEQKNTIHSKEPFFNGGFATFASYSVHGLSFTPLLFRWNLIGHDSNRNIPWIQAGAGVLWTSKRFPQGGGYPGSETSLFNFTPQVGIGNSIFVKRNQSLDFGMRLVEYNSLALGNYNPGTPFVLTFSLGYSWWK